MATTVFRKEYCKRCGLCIAACPKKILSLSEDRLNHKGFHPAVCREPERRTGCAICARTCPDVVIEVYADAAFLPKAGAEAPAPRA